MGLKGANVSILQTNDAGSTWTPRVTTSAEQLDAVAFANASIGVVVGQRMFRPAVMVDARRNSRRRRRRQG